MMLYQHIKTGGLYRVVMDDVIREHDLVECVVYQTIRGMKINWCRPRDEFYDPARFRECPENTTLDSEIVEDEI